MPILSKNLLTDRLFLTVTVDHLTLLASVCEPSSDGGVCVIIWYTYRHNSPSLLSDSYIMEKNMGWNFQPLVLAGILIWHLDMHWIFYGVAFCGLVVRFLY